MKVSAFVFVYFLGNFAATEAFVAFSNKKVKVPLSSASAARNVVLEPSTEKDRFDSAKIGNARVHRYSRPTEADSETEYVMWYHGRQEGMDDDDSLPPLSTGRIGRATSKNGLVWVKDTKGSLSEDVDDVSLGLNKESWWGFDTAHVGLGQILLPMTTPAIMNDSGVYIMYYMGGNFEEQSVDTYMKNIPEGMEDYKVKGMNMKIGVAISQDGISWGRVEGDHPTGACIYPCDRSDINQQNEPIPSDFPEELYCAWPEVVVNLDGNENEKFLMFYSTMLKETKEKVLACAISEDGFRWFKRNIALQPDAGSMDSAGCARCCVLPDSLLDDKGEWQSLSSFQMFYEGVGDDNKHRIMCAESPDGKTWTKTGVALDVGEDSWDSEGVGAPHVIRYVLNV